MNRSIDALAIGLERLRGSALIVAVLYNFVNDVGRYVFGQTFSSAVEVQIDQGPWQTAQLAETIGPDTWRQWKYQWSATSGTHTLTVTARDAVGHTGTNAISIVTANGR